MLNASLVFFLNYRSYLNSALSITGTIYLLLTEFEVSTVSYGPSFFPFDLWSMREARGQ